MEGLDVQFLSPGVSDHPPLVVKLADLPRAKIPFKFFYFWAPHPDFFNLVASVWEEGGDSDVPTLHETKEIEG